jgi:hypothetical protein
LNVLSLAINLISKFIWYNGHSCGDMGTFFCYDQCLGVVMFEIFIFIPLNIIIPLVFTIIIGIKKRKGLKKGEKNEN